MSLLNLLILIIEKSSNLIILVFLTMLLCSLQIFLEIVGYNQNTKSKFYKGIDLLYNLFCMVGTEIYISINHKY